MVRRNEITSAAVAFPLKGPEDVEHFLAIPYSAPESNAAPFHALKARVGEEGLVTVGIEAGVCLPASWFSPEGFCRAWADAPDLVAELTWVGAQRILGTSSNSAWPGWTPSASAAWTTPRCNWAPLVSTPW